MRKIWIILVVYHVGCENVLGGTPIDSAYALTLGGINQWIWMRGQDREAPVLLFLHGGPGNSVMSYARRFTGGLEKSFVVVHWDQRDSGKTLKLNSSPESPTLSLAERDVLELTDYLRRRFAQEKVYLMGHSWGGFLALFVASRHGERFQACYTISPGINQQESERRTLDWMKLEARQSANDEALDDLEAIEIPFVGGEQLYTHRRWLAHFAGSQAPLRSFVLKWADRWLPLYNASLPVNLQDIAAELNCPVYFVLGGKDHQTDWRISHEYFQKVRAPRKDLLMIQASGHNPHLDEPAKFQQFVLQTALPVAR